ncbi:hypothetical protein HOLleu_21950 [Holothuria leucospilota]|uniref:Uncharacterized protein n=1 Tax=Holothuria leucospilota TaxID=206669 RepID=A0A9Q1BXZ9_HOLLE|nr:hypothetical protein HOLleu_21950 [Holothuria leucospilota]
MWMTYGEKMNPVIFGGGQRSFGVTESQILKTLLTQYLKIHHSEKLCHTVLGGGQRSSGSPRVKN